LTTTPTGRCRRRRLELRRPHLDARRFQSSIRRTELNWWPAFPARLPRRHQVLACYVDRISRTSDKTRECHKRDDNGCYVGVRRLPISFGVGPGSNQDEFAKRSTKLTPWGPAVNQSSSSHLAYRTDVFDAAKSVVEALKDLDPPLQKRALHYAAESLGINASSVPNQLSSDIDARRATQVVSHERVADRPSDAKGLRQFVDEKSPQSARRFAIVVAYYYRFIASEAERRDAISATDLTEAARLARRARPVSPRSTLKNAKNDGYLDSAGPGLYKINSSGENLVDAELPASGPSGDIRRRRVTTRSSMARTASVRAKITGAHRTNR
jgi:hypothetical protein